MADDEERQPVCAHMEVRSKAIKDAHDQWMQRWHCTTCGTEFVPHARAALAEVRLSVALRRLLEAFRLLERIHRPAEYSREEMERVLADAKEVLEGNGEGDNRDRR